MISALVVYLDIASFSVKMVVRALEGKKKLICKDYFQEVTRVWA